MVSDFLECEESVLIKQTYVCNKIFIDTLA